MLSGLCGSCYHPLYHRAHLRFGVVGVSRRKKGWQRNGWQRNDQPTDESGSLRAKYSSAIIPLPKNEAPFRRVRDPTYGKNAETFSNTHPQFGVVGLPSRILPSSLTLSFSVHVVSLFICCALHCNKSEMRPVSSALRELTCKVPVKSP